MKKVFISTALAVIILSGFSSCRKCVRCTRDSSPEVTVCEKDYNTNTAYGLTIDGYEATGYHCK
jgi:hypothetical protein